MWDDAVREFAALAVIDGDVDAVDAVRLEAAQDLVVLRLQEIRIVYHWSLRPVGGVEATRHAREEDGSREDEA